jgi:hypothetical protein
VREKVHKGDAEEVVRELVADRMGFQGLRDSSTEHKAKVCELVLQDGWVAKLEALVHSLPEAPRRSMFQKAYDTISFMYQMYSLKKQPDGSGYVVYSASKE